MLSSNISSSCPHNMVNFGPLVAKIISLVWGTPANFNGFRVLAALMHGTLVVGVSQTLRRWTEGATYNRQGARRPSRWALAHAHIYSLSLRCSEHCLLTSLLWILNTTWRHLGKYNNSFWLLLSDFSPNVMKNGLHSAQTSLFHLKICFVSAVLMRNAFETTSPLTDA